MLALFPLLMSAAWSAALAVALLGMAAFTTGSPLQLMVMEKASAAPSLASSANQAAFNLANAGGAWIGGLALAAGFGVTSPAVTGAILAVLGLAVAGVAYLVDLRTPAHGTERLVASGPSRVHEPAGRSRARGTREARTAEAVRALRVPGSQPAAVSRQRLVIGRRRSLPKPFAEIFVPGGYWRRLYSAVSTIRSVFVTSFTVVPGGHDRVGALVLVDVEFQDAVEDRVVGQRVRVDLVGTELRARRLADGVLRDRRRLPPLLGGAVAPPREPEDRRLVDVLDGPVRARGVAVQRRVPHRELGLVARREHDVALLVGERHQHRAVRAAATGGSPRRDP
ncbi:hypothetical protein SALBM135S_06475 [Streptomyces alboniger]